MPPNLSTVTPLHPSKAYLLGNIMHVIHKHLLKDREKMPSQMHTSDTQPGAISKGAEHKVETARLQGKLFPKGDALKA